VKQKGGDGRGVRDNTAAKGEIKGLILYRILAGDGGLATVEVVNAFFDVEDFSAVVKKSPRGHLENLISGNW